MTDLELYERALAGKGIVSKHSREIAEKLPVTVNGDGAAIMVIALAAALDELLERGLGDLLARGVTPLAAETAEPSEPQG